MENIFEKGCLVQLSSSVWGASRKIKSDKLNGIANSPEWLTASKRLVNPEALKPVKKVVNSARSYLAGISLPFPIHGMAFVPKDLISTVDTELGSHKTKFQGEVDRFMMDYDHLREIAMSYLGDLFSEADYPVDLNGKFSFAWRFVILDVPNGNVGVLSPEVYEREKAKFIQTMEEARQLAVRSLREEFSGMVERLTERFTHGPDGKPKVFKNATIDSFYDFFETFKQRNIFNDAGLAELVERAQNILAGNSADHIRSNGMAKEQIRNRMAEVETAMAELFEMPRRKIMMN